MKHKDVIAVYENIIRQTQNNIGKKVNIKYPNRTGIIAVRDYEVTIPRLNRLIARRNKLMGEWGMENVLMVMKIILTLMFIGTIIEYIIKGD